ncbi:ROK family protein [Streptomyces sp. KR80]|uniref:ROK family protein n=1 Tax=Streptomyces sp. KR80 TaxID=3457426 RepID=UPI003FD60E64
MLLTRTAGASPSTASTAVFATVLTQGPISRVQLARRLGLSSAAVTKAARPFLDAGYLQELAATERSGPGAGRPASPLAVSPDREYFVGVKITADELIGVLCDLRAGPRVTARRSLSGRGVRSVTQQLDGLVEELLSGSDTYRDRTRSLGIAVSGDVDRVTGRVRYSPFLGWRDVALGEAVARATGLQVTVENDVKALTVAEHWFGDGVGTDHFALVTVGAGIGCGLVVGGRLLAGSYGVAGEIGHLCVETAGPPCHCGGQGCVEAIAGTDAIVGAARTAATRADLTMDQATELARAGDPAVTAVFARAGQAIGLGLAALANLMGPERIVVSGEGLAAYDLLESHIRRSFAQQTFGAAGQSPLHIRPLPFDEWARGAAAVSIQSRVFP